VGALEVRGDTRLVEVEGAPGGLGRGRRDLREEQETLHDELVLIGGHVEIGDDGGEGKMEVDDRRDLLAAPPLHGHRAHENAREKQEKYHGERENLDAKGHGEDRAI
jgi:hypothetical protein